MKKYFIFAAAAAMFAACSSDDGLTSQTTDKQETAQVPVDFGAYVNRGTTRSGQAGSLDLAGLKGTATSYEPGFGVFAYYTNANSYDQSAIPNFMYNQEVKWDGSNWAYTPIKYWPNEHGSGAISDDIDKVSFFAYAPYVANTSVSSGKVADATYGIIGMSRNSDAGDPLIKYMTGFASGKSVDLLWGVYDESGWKIKQGGATQALTSGLPWLDVQRPNDATVTQKLRFDFVHATAKLIMTVDTKVDGPTVAAPSETTNTKVWIRSIKFKGLAFKGALNLNNTTSKTALWVSTDGTADLESGETVVVYDGRKDGKEGVSGAVDSNEKILGLNSQFIQSETAQNGVNGTETKLFENENVYVIPNGEDLEVEIVYDVETIDANLATLLSDGKTHGSTIENRISKKIQISDANVKLANNKAYTIKLHLGLNSVKFDAAVEGWTDGGTANTDLPAN